MEKKSETHTIEQWLGIVDKPLINKEEDKSNKKTEREDKTKKRIISHVNRTIGTAE